MSLPWGDIIGAALPSLVTAGTSLLADDIKQDRLQDEREYQEQQAREAQALELRLAALKAQYAGGGGGGGGTNPNVMTKAQKVSAIAGQGQMEQDAIRTLLSGLQNAYVR